MPSYRTGQVSEILDERPGLQRVTVDLGQGPEPAYALTALTGSVTVGDRVVVNTTAVELGLGTGGWHFVHWNLERKEWRETGPGHIVKLRYTSLQADLGSVEEEEDDRLHDHRSLEGMPVVACALHSQLPAVTAVLRDRCPDARIAYLMTDGASLPLALSNLVAQLRDRGLVDGTLTAGHAFGGDHEAINVHSALSAARHVMTSDVVVASVGPGIVGTNTALGHTGLDVASVVDATAALGGRPVVALRVSFADQRERHQGVSHHSRTALGIATHARATVPVPAVGGEEEKRLYADLEMSGISERHEVRGVDAPDPFPLFVRHRLEVSSMGRPAPTDPVLYACAAAAAVVAAEMIDG